MHGLIVLIAMLLIPAVVRAETPLLWVSAGLPSAPAYYAEWAPSQDPNGHWVVPPSVPADRFTHVQVAPAGQHWVHIKGMLIITHGQEAWDCNILAWIRTPGGPGITGISVRGLIPFQTVESDPAGGQRTNFHTVVQTDLSGAVEIAWTLANSAGPAPQTLWPQGCAYALTLAIERVE